MRCHGPSVRSIHTASIAHSSEMDDACALCGAEKRSWSCVKDTRTRGLTLSTCCKAMMLVNCLPMFLLAVSTAIHHTTIDLCTGCTEIGKACWKCAIAPKTDFWMCAPRCHCRRSTLASLGAGSCLWRGHARTERLPFLFGRLTLQRHLFVPTKKEYVFF